MKHSFFFIVIILFIVILIALVLRLSKQIDFLQRGGYLKDAKIQLDFANKLLSKGLKEQAAEALEEYINSTPLSLQEEAKLLYKLGGIYMELYKYDKALKNFYKAEMLEPKAEFILQMNQSIIEALESLGLTTQARYELEERTSLSKEVQTKSNIIARIGKREITDAEIDQAINIMPEWMKKDLQDAQKRREFIRDYVAREVLYTKAKRLGLDNKEYVRLALEQFKKQLLIEQFLAKHIQEGLDKVSQEDVKLYYEAHKDDYLEPSQIKLNFLSFTEEFRKEDMTERLKNQQEKFQETWVRETDSSIAGIGEAEDVIKTLFLKEKGEITEPIRIKDKFYIFFIQDKKQKRQKEFSEVSQQVEYEYKMKKQQEIIQGLLNKALEEQEVEIFDVSRKDDTARK
ncbi:MAG: peptidylprolyl isomerase [Candidatus Omnitrophica bacterium]|nr:peptidylprolyl isomerase [Candidatus Omnitrophota bacterium]